MEKFETELLQYFLVNSDVGMGKGKIAAQVAHAATIYTLQNSNILRFQEWFNDIQRKIVLKAPQSLLERLKDTGDYVYVIDKGFTQIEPDTLTVVTLGVTIRGEVEHIVKDLKLL